MNRRLLVNSPVCCGIEILQALQQQSAQIAQVADKVNRQSWLTDFGSDVAANFFTDGLILLARRLFR